MAVAAKKQTWQELQERGGPYSAEEHRVLWDRPGVRKLNDNAWLCGMCNRTIGFHTSADLERAFGPPRSPAPSVSPRTPEEEAQEAVAVEARVKAYGVWERIGQEIGDLLGKRADAQRRMYEAGQPHHISGNIDRTAQDRIRGEIAILDARIADLAAARAQAQEELGRAGVEMDAVLRSVAAARDARTRAARETESGEQAPKTTALQRFLGGR